MPFRPLARRRKPANRASVLAACVKRLGRTIVLISLTLSPVGISRAQQADHCCRAGLHANHRGSLVTDGDSAHGTPACVRCHGPTMTGERS